MRFLLLLTTLAGATAALTVWHIEAPWVVAGALVFHLPLDGILVRGERSVKTLCTLDLLDRVREDETVTFGDLISHCGVDSFLLRRLEEENLVSLERVKERVFSKTGEVLLTRTTRYVHLTVIGRRLLEKRRAET